MKKTLIISCLLMLVFAPLAMAVTNQGDVYVNLSGLWQKISFEESEIEDYEVDDTDLLMIAGGFEYFLTKSISLGLAGMGLWSDYVDLYGGGASLRLYFDTESSIAPYIGGQYNYLKADADEEGDGDAQMYGPVGGLKFFMTEAVTFFVEYQYQIFAGDVEDVLDDSHSVLLGLAYKWR